MSATQPESLPQHRSPSMGNSERRFLPERDLFRDEAPIPGSFNDDAIVRGLLTEIIRTSTKSREQICEELTSLLAERVSVRMLNSYTSEAAEHHRWPAHFTRAFCHITQDWRLLRCIAERANLHLIDESEAELLELGRQYLIRQRAAEQVALLEKRLQGRDF